MRFNFRPLGVDFGLQKNYMGIRDPILVPEGGGEEMYFILGLFWCMAQFIDAIQYLEPFPLWGPATALRFAAARRVVSFSLTKHDFFLFSAKLNQ